MSGRPQHGGRKLLTVNTAHQEGTESKPESPSSSLVPVRLSPGKVAVDESTASLKPLSPSVPLGAIPTEVNARRAVSEALQERDDSNSHVPTSPRAARPRRLEEVEDHDRSDNDTLGADAKTEATRSTAAVAAGRGAKSQELDFLDRESGALLDSTIQQRLGRAFFQSLAIDRQRELFLYPVDEPLHRAIVAEELVDVSMLLDEFGPEAPTKIAARDRNGRTAIHLAAMSSSASIVEALLMCFRRITSQELDHDLARLEADKSRILSDVKAALVRSHPNSMSSSGRTVAMLEASAKDTKQTSSDFVFDVDKSPRVRGVEEWFQKETARRRRQAEIRIEVWWAQLMATRDGFGRTALHYAVGLGAPMSVVTALLTRGRAELGAARTGTKCPLFAKQSVYDSSSGQEIVSFDHATTLAPPSLAAPKADSLKNPDAGDSDEEISPTGLTPHPSATALGIRNIAWELGASLGIATNVPTPEAAAAESFEVVVPWVLRNCVRRATEKAEGGETGVHALEGLVKQVVARPTSTILVPELNRLLGFLGIRVTNEVLRELCRRYPADRDEVTDKWHSVTAQQSEEKKDIARELAAFEKRVSAIKARNAEAGTGTGGHRLGGGSDSKGDARLGMAEEKAGAKSIGGGGGGGGGGDESDAKRGRDAKGRGDDCGDEDDDLLGDSAGSGKGKGKDKDKAKGTVVFTPNEPKAIAERRARLLVMDSIDSDKGVDFLLLLSDIKDGRGLQSLDLRSMTVTSDRDELLKKGIHSIAGSDLGLEKDLEELLGDAAGGSSAPGSRRLAASGASVSSSALPAAPVYAACVSMSSIQKTRRAVVNIQDGFGRSALMLASALGLCDHVSCLLKNQADVSLCTSEGHSALSLARGTATRNVLEKALVVWLCQRDKGLMGGDRRLVEIKSAADLRRSFPESGSGSGAARPLAGKLTDALARSSQSALEQRGAVVSALGAQLESVSSKNWAYGRPPLSWAVCNGLVSVVRKSLAEGSADLARTDTLQRTVMHECVSLVTSATSLDVHLAAAIEIAELLLQAGADCNAASTCGRRPMHDLFCRGQDATASFAKITHKPASTTSASKKALFHVVVSSNVGASKQAAYRRLLMKTMLDYGADPTLLDRQGMGAVHYCARENDAGCMLEIVRRRYDLSKALTSRNQSPLHVACKAGAKDVIELLCRWDADSAPSAALQSQVDAQGKSPSQLLPPSTSASLLETLWSAARQGHTTKVSEILGRMSMSGAPLWESLEASGMSVPSALGGIHGGNASNDNESESSSLSSKPQYNEAGGQELWLLSGVDAKSRRMRWTALHACIAGWAEREALFGSGGAGSKPNLCARRAVGSGQSQVDTSTSASPGSPSRCGAARGGQHADTLQLLLHNNAFVDSVDAQCRTALSLAAAANLTVALDMLLKAGAECNARDLDGRTALHLANAFGSASAIAALEAHGADTELRDNFGKKPFENAGKSGVSLFRM